MPKNERAEYTTPIAAVVFAKDEAQRFAVVADACIELFCQALRAIGEIAVQLADSLRNSPFWSECVSEVILDYAAIEEFPNRRVLHLARHAKKHRARKKNINRILKDREEG